MIHPEVHNIAEAIDVLHATALPLAGRYSAAFQKLYRAEEYLKAQQSGLLAEVLNED